MTTDETRADNEITYAILSKLSLSPTQFLAASALLERPADFDKTAAKIKQLIDLGVLHCWCESSSSYGCGYDVFVSIKPKHVLIGINDMRDSKSLSYLFGVAE